MHFFNDLTPERGWDWIRTLEVYCCALFLLFVAGDVLCVYRSWA